MAGAECGTGGKARKGGAKGSNGTVPGGELNLVAIMGDTDHVRVKGGIPLKVTLAAGACGVVTAVTSNELEEGRVPVEDSAGMSGGGMIA